MKILVTGAAGFIGSHTCEKLLSLGHKVLGLDNFNDFYNPDVKRQNISRSCLSSAFTLIEGDILNDSLLFEIFSAHKIDAVVHLAAWAGVRPSMQNPKIYQSVNIEGTLNLLEACKEAKVTRFIFASSSSVYGGRENIPFCESDDIMKPISPYAATKVAGEALCYTYFHLHGISSSLLRFFTVYGPRQRPEMAIHLFAKKILQKEAIILFGDGTSSRDYTYIDDIVDGIISSIYNCNGCEVFNLGGNKTVSLNSLIDIISTTLDIEANISYKPQQPGDVPITCAEISKAHQKLKYWPKTSIHEGVSLFCKWLKSTI